ncbi:galanin receptor type 2-like [Trematomus bernacchii]|uniref:galanin receptor type 2-like n=1 Tax=Trematomus bernacchii TaxID=40690 RepID=UPI00146DDB08|nr:galanin receptor type 2-like [Trematomus bernacchii]
MDGRNETASIPDLVWYFLPTIVLVPPLGIPANALVLRLLLGKPNICSTSEIFVLNLAVFDMMFCFMVVIEYIYFMFNKTMANSHFLSWGLSQAGGPMLLCALSLDAFMAVCHPLIFLRLKEPKLRLSLCLLVSVLAFTVCGLAKLMPVYKMWMMLGILMVAMLTISTCNVLILKSLRRPGPGGKDLHPVKKRAFKIVFTALVMMNFHYLPSLAESLIKVLFPTLLLPYYIITSFTYLILSMSSFIQPLSYLVRTKQLPKMRCNEKAETKTIATS